MKMRNFFAAVTIVGAAAAGSAQAKILTDVIFVVDESGSMGTVQTNLRTNIGLFASILTGTGQVDAQYGLVGYGNYQTKPRMLTDLTDDASFATAAASLQTNGVTEPGYAATAYALNSLDGQTDFFSFRQNSVKNVIILTDEPSNGDTGYYSSYTISGSPITEAAVDGVLSSNGALYNGVLKYSNTIDSYGDLIQDHSGQIFDLNLFNTTDQSVVGQFVTDFANAKLQETIDFCVANPTDPACQEFEEPSASVPESSTLALFGIGLAGLGLSRRRSQSSKKVAVA